MKSGAGDLERAIGHVADELTSIDAAGFADRVRARLVAGTRPPVRLPFWSMMAAATCAAVLLAVALTPTKDAGAPTNSDSAAPLVASRPPVVSIPAAAIAAPTDQPRRTARAAESRATAAELEWSDRALPKLEEAAPLAFADIDPGVLHLPELVVSPLSASDVNK